MRRNSPCRPATNVPAYAPTSKRSFCLCSCYWESANATLLLNIILSSSRNKAFLRNDVLTIHANASNSSNGGGNGDDEDDGTTSMNISSGSTSTAVLEQDEHHNNNHDNHTSTTMIPIFYNLYNPQEIDRTEAVKVIMEEQLSYRGPIHREIYVRSIGRSSKKLEETIHRLKGTTTTTLLQHDENGTEIDTLGHLWDYCKKNHHRRPNQKVVYLHSKGSFHPSEKNDALRRFLTRGALSEECSNLPDWCNVCSSRMSPIPHAHTPGNMWLARCDYVHRLMDPRLFTQEMDRIKKNGGAGMMDPKLMHCHGVGRYAAEHWIHSHFLVSSCDLSNDTRYIWGYNDIPPPDFRMELKSAPRFNFSTFVPRKNRCGYTKDGKNASSFGRAVLHEYKMLYGGGDDGDRMLPPPNKWFGWDFYNLRVNESGTY